MSIPGEDIGDRIYGIILGKMGLDRASIPAKIYFFVCSSPCSAATATAPARESTSSLLKIWVR